MMTVASKPSRTMTRSENQNTDSRVDVRRAPAARGEIYIINMSGRGDKDIDIYRENLKELDAD